MKTIILCLVMVLAPLFLVLTANAQSVAPAQLPEGKVQSSYVCYVNNKYMGKEQIPVEVEGKVYYGCCQGCVVTLQTRRDMRYAIDPLTEKEVDKATAFIVIKPGSDGAVQYFESEKNYQIYSIQ
jgi:YHS domain-containing protein